MRYIADTHTIIWYVVEPKRLSRAIKSIFKRTENYTDQIIVPSIVIVETTMLVQRQKVSELALGFLTSLSEDAEASIRVYPLTLAVAEAAGHFGPAAIPELADRIIAATALHLGLPLLTADPAIQSSDLIETIW